MTHPPTPPVPPPPRQSAQSQPPLGFIQLTVQGSMLTSNLITPKAWINGYPVQVQYGLNTIPMPPGPVRIDLNNQWMRTYGQASIEFLLEANHTVPVFYAAPAHQFTTGSIGFERVKHKGRVALFAGLGVVIAAIIAVAILAATLG